MTWLRTPPEAEPDVPAAENARQDATVARDSRDATADGQRDAPADGLAQRAADGQRDAAADGLDASPDGQRDAPADGLDAAAPATTSRPVGVALGVVGWLRWGWRQLTSMRTALILLFLLAAGSVPGSLLPQVGTNPAAVSQYYSSHPLLARILGDLSLFNVFGAPWFAAVYILLFTSLVGCVLPRTLRLVGSARQPPPRAPGNLARLPFAVSYATPLAPEAALESAAKALSAKRFRLRTGPGWVAAEKGYLREVGNLLFHMALLGLLVSIGLGGLFGYKADRLLVSGTSFPNTVTALDEFHPGRLVGPDDLQPFTVALDHFSASYVTSGPLLGQPSSFVAAIRYSASPQDPDAQLLADRQPPAGRGRRPGLPHRPWLRPDLPGHRRHRARGLRGSRPVHPRRIRWAGFRGRDQGSGRQPPGAWVRRRVPAERHRRGRPAGVILPGATEPDGEPGVLRGQPRHELRARRSRCTRWTPPGCASCRSPRGRWPSASR